MVTNKFVVSDEIKKKMIEFLDGKSVDWHTHEASRDELNKIANDGFEALNDIENEMYEYNDYWAYDEVSGIIGRAMEKFLPKEIVKAVFDSYEYTFDFSEYPKLEELVEELREYVSVYPNLDYLLKETVLVNVCFPLNGDVTNWFSTFANMKEQGDNYSSFSHVLSLLNINPRLVSEKVGMKKKWPNLPSREGKEFVDVEDFISLCINENTTDYALFSMYIAIPISLYHTYKEIKENNTLIKYKIKIPRNTSVGFWGAHDGTMSCNTELIKDFEISLDKVDLIIDGYYGYGIDEICCGMSDSFWVKGAKILDKKAK